MFFQKVNNIIKTKKKKTILNIKNSYKKTFYKLIKNNFFLLNKNNTYYTNFFGNKTLCTKIKKNDTKY